MANMSYCRFQNTLSDLRDCEDYVEDLNLSEEENNARIRLIEVCKSIVDRFDKDEDEDLEDLNIHFEDNQEN